jgi:formylglycine-generating enzyme required for sulfatase activity
VSDTLQVALRGSGLNQVKVLHRPRLLSDNGPSYVSSELGSERHRPEERFTHIVRVDGFWIDRYEVTNAWNGKLCNSPGFLRAAKNDLMKSWVPSLEPVSPITQQSM